jgi:hypothetical protein
MRLTGNTIVITGGTSGIGRRSLSKAVCGFVDYTGAGDVGLEAGSRVLNQKTLNRILNKSHLRKPTSGQTGSNVPAKRRRPARLK